MQAIAVAEQQLLLYSPNSLVFLSPPHRRRGQATLRFSGRRISAMSLETGLRGTSDVVEPMTNILNFDGAKETTQKMFDKVELTVSAYDTAWVAMVPSPSSSVTPCFPDSVNWILANQCSDGSWGLPDSHPSLIKDSVSSTLACVLALKKWNLGEEQIIKGLDFIVSNFASVMDEKLHSSVGFNIIFPGMIEKGIEMELNLPLTQTDIEALFRKRDSELRRIHGKSSRVRNFYLAYISEGLGKSQDWEMIMTYQRKNGSLFNSPSATAAMVSLFPNSGCYQYLCSLLEKYEDAVPTVHPLDAYARLCMVDTLQNLGIDRHFRENIRLILDETYRQWTQGQEEIFLDIATCGLAFRLLRVHGYDISSEPLAKFSEDDYCFHAYGEHLEDLIATLGLFRASQLNIYPHESYLEKQKTQTRNFLKEQLSNPLMLEDGFIEHIIQEVKDALNSPFYGNWERLTTRKYIEDYSLDKTRILKTSFRCMNFSNEELLKLAVKDFNYCQSIHIKEFKLLQRWVTENKLDQLTFSRQKLSYCYFSAAATVFEPELSDARMSWAKNAILTTVVDDFFDVGSSEEEELNLIQLFERWDGNEAVVCSSEKVKIVFSALYHTVCEIGDKAFTWQDRNVTDHIVDTWLSLIKSMWRESEMSRKNTVPTMEEYMANAYVSFALGPIVLPALYFVGPKLSEDIVGSTEYHNLFELMSTCGRLLNDLRGFQRESREGKLNAVSLHLLNNKNTISEDNAAIEMKRMIESKRRELLRMVLEERESVIPRECKEMFWKMSKVLHLFYVKDDGFTSDELESTLKSVFFHPILR